VIRVLLWQTLKPSAVLLSVAYQFLRYSFTFSPKQNNFMERIYWNKLCVFYFSVNIYENFLILWRIEQDVIRNVYRSLPKVAVIVPHIKELYITRRIFEEKRISICRDIRLMDGQQDEQQDWHRNMIKLTVTYRSPASTQYGRYIHAVSWFATCLLCTVRPTSNFKSRRRQ
jgi:hypothetical protein